MYVCYVLFNKYSKYRITGGPNHGNKEAKQNIQLSQHAQTPSAVQVAKCRHRLNENFPSRMGQYGLMSNLFELLLAVVSSVLSCCWLGTKKSIWPVKIEWWGYLSGERCRLFAYHPADATTSQNPIISCLIEIQTGFTFLCQKHWRQKH